jgi:hypothetical protein
MMALKKVKKLSEVAADADAKVEGAEGTEVAEGGKKALKPRAPGGRKSGRTWVIPRKRAEVIVQLAGNAGKEKLIALVEKINKPDISVNNAANIKYALSQIAKKPDAYKHRGTQQFDRLAYAIAHKESALTNEDLVELELVPEGEDGELQYGLVEADMLSAPAEESAPAAAPVSEGAEVSDAATPAAE